MIAMVMFNITFAPQAIYSPGDISTQFLQSDAVSSDKRGIAVALRWLIDRRPAHAGLILLCPAHRPGGIQCRFLARQGMGLAGSCGFTFDLLPDGRV